MKRSPVFQLVAKLYAAELVRAAYLGMLGRLPDDAGLKAYCAELGSGLKGGKGLAGLLTAVATSQEHWERSLARRSQELVLALYRSIFNRYPDSQRLQGYATQLKANKDIPGLLSAIGASQEFWERQR